METEEKRKRTASERDEEQKENDSVVGPLPVEHDPDDMQVAKKMKREWVDRQE